MRTRSVYDERITEQLGSKYEKEAGAYLEKHGI